MGFTYILGVDMSRDWFHYCVMDDRFNIVLEGQVVNRPDHIFSWISVLSKQLNIQDIKSILLCIEHTGIYVNHLMKCWLSKGGGLSLIPSVKVSDQLAGKHGWNEKDDAIDARRLAEYGIRFRDKLKLWELKNHSLTMLQCLQRQRSRLIKAINLLEVPVEESGEFEVVSISEALRKNQQKSIQALNNDLKDIEKQLDQVIEDDPTLKHLYQLIQSVPGVGPVTAREVLITTEGFNKFSPNQAKKYARYAGVVPLKHRSGSSIHRRDKTSNRANQTLKSLLTMGSTSLIGRVGELGHYYERRKKDGKDHLCIINAMRNKLILRIFAVVRNQVMYNEKIVCV